MKATHLVISQEELEQRFQSATTEDQKQFIMDLWEAGKDIDLSTTTIAMNIAAASKYESISVFQKYFSNGYKKAIEHFTPPPPATAAAPPTTPTV